MISLSDYEKVILFFGPGIRFYPGFFISFFSDGNKEDERFLSYKVDLKTADLKLYWKDSNNQNIHSLQRLKEILESQHRKLLFAMNGGMCKNDNSPQGLYIESNKVISKLDTDSGNGNFYLKPNGVFYLTRDNKAVVCKTEDFKMDNNIPSFGFTSNIMAIISLFIV